MAMNRWARLLAIGFSLIICAGLVPGQSLFIELFVSAGVGASKCADAATKISCDQQYEFVGQSFNVGQYASLCLTLIQGMLFDRFGARWMAVNGCIIVLVGTWLVLIPVAGAAYGYDASTCSYLALPLLLTDIGTNTQGWSSISLLALFPDYPTVALSMMAGTYSAGAFTPDLFEYFMDWTGCSLLQALVGFSSMMVVSLILCTIFVPSREEFRALFQGETGPPLPILHEEVHRLQMQIQQARAEKLTAAEAEDFDAAKAAKQKEAALLAVLSSLQEEKSRKAELQAELEKCIAGKAAAIAKEDFVAAQQFKEREKECQAELEAIKEKDEEDTWEEDTWSKHIYDTVVWALWGNRQEEQQKEEKKEEKKKEPTPWQEVRKAFFTLKAHLVDHIVWWLGMCWPYGVATFYLSMLGDYGRMMLDSNKAMTALPETATVAIAFLGAVGGPLISILADKSRNSQIFLTALCFILLLMGTGTVLGSTWMSQEICLYTTSFFQIVHGILCQVRCYGLCLPADVGTVSGLFMTVVSLLSMAFNQLPYFIAGQFPSEELPQIMFGVMAVGTVLNLVNILHISVKGQPKGPVIIADDENGLSQPFGDQNLKQVLYVTHTEHSPEAPSKLLKRLTGGDPKVIPDLLTSVDTDRVDELAMESSTTNDIEELAIAIGQGKDIKSGVPNEPLAFTRPDVSQYRMSREGRSIDDAMTICSLTCAAQPGGSGAVSRTVACNMMPPSRLCLPKSNNQRFGNGFASEPLLGDFQKSPFAGDAVPSVEDLKGSHTKAVWDLNWRLLNAVQAGQKDVVLSIYEKEDPKLLLEAYQDLLDNVIPDKNELMKFEKDAEALLPDEELQELIKRRPALASVFVKFTAYRMKKNILR